MEDELSIVEWVNLSNRVSELEIRNKELSEVISSMAEYIVRSIAPNWDVDSVTRHFANKVKEQNNLTEDQKCES